MQILCLMIGFGVPLAKSWAEESPAPTQDCSFQKFKEALAGRESGGNYGAVNSYGYSGKYQFGEEALASVGMYNGDGSTRGYQNFGGSFNYPGVNSIEDFRNNPAAQEEAMNRLVAQNERTMNQSITYRGNRYPPLSSYVGQTINGVEMTESGILAACHLRGCAGLSACLGGNGPCTDGYGTSVFEYIGKFGNYDTNSGSANNTGCKNTPNKGASRSETHGNPMCSEDIRAEVTRQIQASLAKRQDIWNTYYTPPAQLSQLANTPCMSQELQRINRQMNGMLQSGVRGIGNATGLGTSSISSIMNNAFKGDTNTFNSSASMIPGMLNFQSIASNALGGLLQELGLGDAFSGKVCGIMLDMVLKYIQCENPIKFPNLSNMFGNLNLNLPNNCAGQAARQGLIGLTQGTAARPLAQQIKLK